MARFDTRRDKKNFSPLQFICLIGGEKMIYARYGTKEISEDMYLGTLNFVGSSGGYRLFRFWPSGEHVVTFQDQSRLFTHMKEGEGRICLIKFLEKGNNKETYEVFVNGEPVIAHTVGGFKALSDELLTLKYTGERVLVDVER